MNSFVTKPLGREKSCEYKGATGKAGNGKRDGKGNGKWERETGNENLREASRDNSNSRLSSSREPGTSRSKDSR